MAGYELHINDDLDARVTVGANKIGIERKRFVGRALDLLASIVDYLHINKRWKLALVDENNVVKKVFVDVMKK